MKAKFLICLLAAATAFSAAGVAAGCGDGTGENAENLTPTEGLEYTLSGDGKSYEVTGLGTAEGEDIVIAAEYESKPVTAIGKEAFKECRNITEVTIPDSVTVIKTSAFSDCTKLEKVKFSSVLEEIWQYAFFMCVNLENVTLPDTVNSIGDHAFLGDGENKLKKLNYTLYECGLYLGTKDNPRYALVGMDYTLFTGITIIHKDTKVVADGAFDNTLNDAKRIYVSKEVNGINFGRGAIFDGTLNTLLANYYNGGYYLGEVDDEQSYLVLVRTNSAVKIAEGVKAITSNGLKGFSGETEIVIPDGVDSLGEYACYGFGKLEKITLPASLAFIPRYSFGKCSALTDITYKGTKAQWNALTKGGNWDNGTAQYTIHCSDGEIAKS